MVSLTLHGRGVAAWIRGAEMVTWEQALYLVHALIETKLPMA